MQALQISNPNLRCQKRASYLKVEDPTTKNWKIMSNFMTGNLSTKSTNHQLRSISDKRAADVFEFSKDPLLHRKIEMICDGLDNGARQMFLELKEDNRRVLAEFMNDMIVHENPRPNTKRVYIADLTLLSRYFEHKKQWREFTRDDVMMFLQSYRKTPAVDHKERWISTVNRKTIIVQKFFKWLYYPTLDREQRNKKEKPDVVKDLPRYRKKEKTSVEATDLWLPPEDKVFLRYCPDVRLQLYHTMADDTSGRPHEILAKRFSDVKIKQHNGRIFGEMMIGRGGKTKGRIVPLITSIPYFKQWQSQNNDPNAFIFRAFSPQAKYKNRPMNANALYHAYRRMKEYFKTLLDRPDVPPEDKAIIKNMLQKPWNPYIKRHQSLTEKARLLKNDYSLRLHAGWTKNSKMVGLTQFAE